MYYGFSARLGRLVLLVATPVFIIAQNANTPSGMAGTWSSSEVRTVQFNDRATGAFAKPSGATITYHITDNGDFQEQTLIQTSMYNCSDVVFATESGRVHVDGTKLVFDSIGGRLTSQDNCNARFNYAKQVPANQRVFTQWSIRNGQAGPELCMSDDKNHLCYKRNN